MQTATAFSRALYQMAKCPFGDCCNDHWIINDIDNLQKVFSRELFGQHIAAGAILNQLKSHLSNKSPSKPLVMSFHGLSGSGKTHASYLIAKGLFRNGAASKHFHHFMPSVHFPHRYYDSVYQDQVRDWIKGNVSSCPRSVFIFDDVDQLPAGFLDGIYSFLDYNEHVDGVDYRKAIFIFTNEAAGNVVGQKVHQVWTEGKRRREELTLADFERSLLLGAYNEQSSGLYKSKMIKNCLIDAYVPFLPLEKAHVRLCARWQFKKQNFVFKND